MYFWLSLFIVACALSAAAFATNSAASSTAKTKAQPTRGLATVMDEPSAGKEALLAQLQKTCVDSSSEHDSATIKEICTCVVSHHRATTPTRYLREVIDAYAGRKSFESPRIADDVSVVLNNDADALKRCEAQATNKSKQVKKK